MVCKIASHYQNPAFFFLYHFLYLIFVIRLHFFSAKTYWYIWGGRTFSFYSQKNLFFEFINSIRVSNELKFDRNNALNFLYCFPFE